jgi:hypothetical protein
LALTNGNLRAQPTIPSTNSSVRATRPRTTGKFYFEAAWFGGVSGNQHIGLCDATTIMNGSPDTHSFTQSSSGQMYLGGTFTGVTGVAWAAAGQFCRVAVDLDARLFWIGAVGQPWNASGTADPATGVGGTAFPAALTAGVPLYPMSYLYQTPSILELNCGATAFNGVVPNGFATWNGGATVLNVADSVTMSDAATPSRLWSVTPADTVTMTDTPGVGILFVDALLVAGGGGGAGATTSIPPGGGGGGGVLFSAANGITPGSYSIVVGAAGVGGAVNTGSGSTPGGNSTAFGLTAQGGGVGSFNGAVGGNGGCGGGGSGGATVAGGTGVAGQGFAGGTSDAGNSFATGGGGGAGAVGVSGSFRVSGAGGAGKSSSISGAAVLYGGGGGGGGNNPTPITPGAGGSGGGGAGGGASAPTAGANGLGGGGGGGSMSPITAGANGGSGVVVLSYPTGSMFASGGTKTTSGGNTIHTFTSNGTFIASAGVSNLLQESGSKLLQEK